jgi:hypothetical protein
MENLLATADLSLLCSAGILAENMLDMDWPSYGVSKDA